MHLCSSFSSCVCTGHVGSIFFLSSHILYISCSGNTGRPAYLALEVFMCYQYTHIASMCKVLWHPAVHSMELDYITSPTPSSVIGKLTSQTRYIGSYQTDLIV